MPLTALPACVGTCLGVDEERVPSGKAHEDAILDRVSITGQSRDRPRSDLPASPGWQQHHSGNEEHWIVGEAGTTRALWSYT